MVEKVKNALPALEDIVDENILDYCTLDKKVPINPFNAVTLLEIFVSRFSDADTYLGVSW